MRPSLNRWRQWNIVRLWVDASLYEYKLCWYEQHLQLGSGCPQGVLRMKNWAAQLLSYLFMNRYIQTNMWLLIWMGKTQEESRWQSAGIIISDSSTKHPCASTRLKCKGFRSHYIDDYVKPSSFNLQRFGPMHYEYLNPGEDDGLVIYFGNGAPGKSHLWRHLLTSNGTTYGKLQITFFCSYLRTGQCNMRIRSEMCRMEVDSIDLACDTFPFSASVSGIPGREADLEIIIIVWDSFGDSGAIEIEFGTNGFSVNDVSDVACFLAVSFPLLVIFPRPRLYICDSCSPWHWWDNSSEYAIIPDSAICVQQYGRLDSQIQWDVNINSRWPEFLGIWKANLKSIIDLTKCTASHGGFYAKWLQARGPRKSSGAQQDKLDALGGDGEPSQERKRGRSRRQHN